MSAETLTASVPCIVLAGGKAKPEIQAVTGQSNRALVVVQGKTLLRHVVDAARDAAAPRGPIGSVTVVGDVPESGDYTRLPDSGSFVENILAGVSAHAASPYVLVTTSDLPFLTGEVVADFARQAEAKAKETGAGFIWPVVPVASCYERFPGVRRTAWRLKEGEYTGGNVALVRPEFLLAQRQRIADAYDARKSVVRLAGMIGWGTLLRLALSKISPRVLSVSLLEARVSRLLGSPARALICDHPELATDIDRPSDFAAVGLTQENRPA